MRLIAAVVAAVMLLAPSIELQELYREPVKGGEEVYIWAIMHEQDWCQKPETSFVQLSKNIPEIKATFEPEAFISPIVYELSFTGASRTTYQLFVSGCGASQTMVLTIN